CRGDQQRCPTGSDTTRRQVTTTVPVTITLPAARGSSSRHPPANAEANHAACRARIVVMSHRPITGEEWMAFLVATPRPAVLATTRSDGRPHAAPIWIDVDQGAVWFNPGAETVKGRNLTRTG